MLKIWSSFTNLFYCFQNAKELIQKDLISSYPDWVDQDYDEHTGKKTEGRTLEAIMLSKILISDSTHKLE